LLHYIITHQTSREEKDCTQTVCVISFTIVWNIFKCLAELHPKKCAENPLLGSHFNEIWEVTTNFTELPTIKFHANSPVHELLHVNRPITVKLTTTSLQAFVVNTPPPQKKNRKREGTKAPWKSKRQNHDIKNFKLWFQSTWYPTFP
jgi:hypothetical protein